MESGRRTSGDLRLVGVHHLEADAAARQRRKAEAGVVVQQHVRICEVCRV